MKKHHGDTRPEAIESIGNGKWHVNLDIEEVTIPDEMGGETRTEYQYYIVESVGIPTYGVVVDLLIRERYSISDELALQRQMYTKVADFDEYNSYCEWCKSIARPVFYPEENGGE